MTTVQIIMRNDDGSEVWAVTTPDGLRQTMKCSASSVRAIERAVVIFERALRRLADQ